MAKKDITKWEDYDEIICPDGTVIDMQKLLDDQERAKAALIHLAPVFGGFISKLKPIYTFHIETQATDGRHLFINPQFTDSLDLTGKVFVMAHELMHNILNHCRRGWNMKDHYKSNVAADYEVNITLVDMGMFREDTIKKLKAFIDKSYSKMSFEAIYDRISSPNAGTQDNEKGEKQAEQGRGQKQGQGSGSGGGKSQPKSADYKAGWAQAVADYRAGKIKL